MSKPDPDTIDAAFTNLLANLPPEIVERVRAKYEADREEFIAYVKDNTPSNSPAYWASKGCTKCHGRGIIGELTTPKGTKQPLVCYCVSKGYQKWLTEQRKIFNSRKEESNT